MADNVLVFAEQREGKFRKVALEAVSEGKRLADKLGGELNAAVIGSGVEGMAGSLGAYGAAKVYVVDDPLWRTTQPTDSLKRSAG